jgi:hypothetical protein
LHDAAVLGYLQTFSPGGLSSVSGFTERATPMAERWPARYVGTGAGSTARQVGHRAHSVDLSADETPVERHRRPRLTRRLLLGGAAVRECSEEQVMRVSGVLASAMMAAVPMFAGLGPPPPARASVGGVDLNGIYIAQSNGQWARTNERYQDEATVRNTWTITSTCVAALECTGRVTSDQGWSNDIYSKSGIWYLKRNLDNWEPCYDGSSAPGFQVILFYSVNSNGQTDPASTTYAGEDKTTSPSGSCGRNQSLVIRMPFRLEKVA